MENTVKESIKKLIVEGKTRRAIEQLKEVAPSTSSKKILTIIESEFTSIRKKELSGTMSHSEVQLAKNQINDKLLGILEGEVDETTTKNSSSFFKILIPIALITLGALGWWMMYAPDTPCPDYPSDVNNRILILPFENIGATINDAKPQVALANRINTLTYKNNLSSHAEIGTPYENLNMIKAGALAQICDANLIIWGTYSSKSDSIRLIMNYQFIERPNQNELGDITSLKDITELQNGKMTKELDDAILSLCGIIAIREGNAPVAKKWFEKVKEKEEFDKRLLEKL